MRLFDKVLTHRRYGLDARLSAPRITVVAADAVASHAHSHWEFSRKQSDFPFSVVPFQECFVEWNHPLYSHAGQIQQVGVKVDNSTSDREPRRMHEQNIYSASRMFVEGLGAGVGTEEYDTEVVMSVFVCVRGTVLGMPYPTWLYYRNENLIFARAWGWGAAHGLGDDEIPESLLSRAEVLEIVRIALLAFTFLNCSNVKLQDVTEELEPPPKIKRRLRIPDVKRYTLNINGHYSKPRRELGEPGEKDVMPFHLCRGHFATYTDAAPLFGKYTGRFWIPPHTKGKRENGVIEKDYAIVN